MTAMAQLEAAIPDGLADEFLKRLPYLSEGLREYRLLPGADTVEFVVHPGFESYIDLIAARIREVAAALVSTHYPTASKSLARRDTLPSSYRDDPHPELMSQGAIRSFGRGRYGLGPKVVRLIAYFDLRCQQIAREFSADTYIFPSLIGADVLDRCRYLRNFPASLNLVTHLREDHGLLQDFARTAHWDGKQLRFSRDSESTIECLLSPSVCFHWYMWLKDSFIAEPLVITAVGKCFRYESSNLSGLERLWDFSMREVVVVGTPSAVLQNRERMIEVSVRLLDELEMAYEVTSATDPFFTDSYAAQAAYQQGFELKFELLAPLPYSGKKLAVGSINYHQDVFGRTFGIQGPEGPVHTGCLGFGYERLALAFIAQHGTDETRWPSAVTRGFRQVQVSDQL